MPAAGRVGAVSSMGDVNASPCFLWTSYDPCVESAVVQYVKAAAGSAKQLHILRTESLADDLSSSTLFGFLVDVLRKHNVLSNWRTTILSVNEHYQALQLCTARVRQKSGKYDALASEVLYHDSLYLKHLTDRDAPVTSEHVQEYIDFLAHSNTMNNWLILRKFMDALEEDDALAKYASESAYLVHGPITTPFTKECIELLFRSRTPRRIVTEAPLDMSVNENYDISDVAVDSEEMAGVPEPDESTVEKLDSNTADYMVRMVNAFFRVLVNSRDELALTMVMASPVVKLGQDAFTELRRLSLEKKIPLCQTAVSYVMRARLGGDSYKAPEKCPLKAHVCKLAAFVDLLHKLQAAIEEDPTAEAVAKIIRILTHQVRTATGHGLVWETVARFKTQLMQLARRVQNESSTEDVSGGADGLVGTGTLHILRRLSDFLSTRRASCRRVLLLYNLNIYRTPLHLPELLQYFKTPESEDEDDGFDVPLTERILAKYYPDGTPCPTIIQARAKPKGGLNAEQHGEEPLANKLEETPPPPKALPKGRQPAAVPKKAAKRNILADINVSSKRRKINTISKDQAKITTFFFKP